MAGSSWGAFLQAITGPIARRAMAALGIGALTMAGLGVVETQIGQSVTDAWSGIGGDVYAVLQLGGWVDAVSIWLSSISTVVAWLALARLAPLPGASGS